ncbi:MAG: RNA 2',3'-cyclic phosphodiesterase, partial [Candidatus Hecatellales archaeon]
PNLNRPRVIWVGVSEGADRLKALAGEVERLMARVGFKPDPKGFTPHLTLARVRAPRSGGRLSALLRQLSGFEAGEMTVDCLRLKRSVLTAKGPIYSNLYEVRAFED